MGKDNLSGTWNGVATGGLLRQCATSEYEEFRDSVNGVESLKIEVGGGRYNAGMEAVSTEYKIAQLDVRTDKLDIKVTGGESAEETASYGVIVKGHQSEAAIIADRLDITVRDERKAVGLSADGLGQKVSVYSSTGYEFDEYGCSTRQHHALSMVITCRVTDTAGLLKGIAVEALAGGAVEISSVDSYLGKYYDERNKSAASNVTLNGHVTAAGAHVSDEWSRYPVTESRVSIELGAGNDRLEINGDTTARDGGAVKINMGEGDDSITLNGHVTATGGILNPFIYPNYPNTSRYRTSRIEVAYGDDESRNRLEVNGDITAGDGGTVRIDAGFGDFLFRLNGRIAADGDFRLDAPGKPPTVTKSEVEILLGGYNILEINGDIAADNGGRVKIHNGHESRLEINGDITAGNGASVDIAGSSGDDVIALNGAVRQDSGTVNISGGGGYDTLILNASSAEEFKEWYEGWLNAVNFQDLGCERIIIHGVEPSDSAMLWLSALLQDYADSNSDFGFQYNWDDRIYGFGNGALTLVGSAEGDDVIRAFNDHGNRLIGGWGDNAIFGGQGDDEIHAGGGNNFLDGVGGHNRIYGGNGNDIMVWHKDDDFDGGGGLDALLVNMLESGDETLDDLFCAAGTDVVIQVNGSLSRDDLAAMGLAMRDDGLHLSGNWTQQAPADEYEDRTTFSNVSGALVTVDHNNALIDMTVHEIIIKSAYY
jgi:Ca2+-binding RTX toxin-like protein